MNKLAEVIDGIFTVIIVLFICELCGCGVCESIGDMAGRCVKAYQNAVNYGIHPSEAR